MNDETIKELDNDSLKELLIELEKLDLECEEKINKEEVDYNE